MGVGKTCAAVHVLRGKYNTHGKVLPTLVLGPLIVVEQWADEIKRFSKIPHDRITPLTGKTGVQRHNQLRDALAESPDRIVVTNYETLQIPRVYDLLTKWAPDCLVVDEAHRIKRSSSKRAKLTTKLADRAHTCRLLLTGTPILNSPMDLFSQYRALDRGKTFGTNFVSFVAKYFYDANAAWRSSPKHFPDWRLRPGALEAFNKAISESSMTVEKKDCLDLPPLVRKVIHVPLSQSQKRLYDDLKKDFVAYLADKACVATLAITKALRLQQIVSGYVALEDEGGAKSTKQLENPRAAVLRELLEEIAPHHKVIVWCVFRQNYETVRGICDALQLQAVEVHGDVPNEEKFAAIKRFEADDACRVLIGHPGSGGVGVNLTAASYSIFYSRGFSLEFDLQAESRNWRGGSERHACITRIDLVAPGTIDEAVMEALASKVAISDKVLREASKRI
jgi:SNF2 family DNA or RNA helicase